MFLKQYFQSILLIVASAMALSSCSGTKGDLVLLETFAKNSVTVSIYLKTPQNGQNAIVASFAPPEGSHLYSKNIPRDGVDGLGRPTLLELTQNSGMEAAGELIENTAAKIPEFEPKDLLVYPAGPVTLTLPVTLPTGKNWVNDEVSITYMACNDQGCKPPVVNQIITLHIPPSQ